MRRSMERRTEQLDLSAIVVLASELGNAPLEYEQLLNICLYLNNLPVEEIARTLSWFELTPYWQIMHALMSWHDRDIAKERLIKEHGIYHEPEITERSYRLMSYELALAKTMAEYYKDRWEVLQTPRETDNMEMRPNVITK
jgi:hypothetical protein